MTKLLYILFINFLLSTIAGTLHLLLFDVSLLLKLIAIFNLTFALFYFTSKIKIVLFCEVIFLFSIAALGFVDLFYSIYIDTPIERAIIDLTGLLVPFTCTLLLGSGFRSRDYQIDIVTVMKFTLVFSLLNVSFMFSLKYLLGLHFNLTFGSPLIALSAAISVYQRRLGWFSLSAFLTILSGKRSIMLMVFLSSSITYLVTLYQGHNLKSITRSMSSILVTAFLLLSIVFLNWNTIVKVNPKLKKVEYLFSNEADMYQRTTGRMDEISQVFERYTWGCSELLFGLGLGSSFNISFDKYSVTRDKNNIHFSPLNIFSKFGLLFTIFFYLYFVFKFYSCWRRAGDYMPLAVYCMLYVFFYSMTSYGFAVDFSFWIVLAIFIGGATLSQSEKKIVQ